MADVFEVNRHFIEQNSTLRAGGRKEKLLCWFGFGKKSHNTIHCLLWLNFTIFNLPAIWWVSRKSMIRRLLNVGRPGTGR